MMMKLNQTNNPRKRILLASACLGLVTVMNIGCKVDIPVCDITPPTPEISPSVLPSSHPFGENVTYYENSLSGIITAGQNAIVKIHSVTKDKPYEKSLTINTVEENGTYHFTKISAPSHVKIEVTCANGNQFSKEVKIPTFTIGPTALPPLPPQANFDCSNQVNEPKPATAPTPVPSATLIPTPTATPVIDYVDKTGMTNSSFKSTYEL